MESEGSLPCSQQSATDPYPVTRASSPNLPPSAISPRSILILSSHLQLIKRRDNFTFTLHNAVVDQLQQNVSPAPEFTHNTGNTPFCRFWITMRGRPKAHHVNTRTAQSVEWLEMDDRGWIPARDRDFISSPPRPDRLWGPPS